MRSRLEVSVNKQLRNTVRLLRRSVKRGHRVRDQHSVVHVVRHVTKRTYGVGDVKKICETSCGITIYFEDCRVVKRGATCIICVTRAL